MEILVILVCIAIPLGVYFWRESRYRNPATRWPRLAESMGLQFQPNPPRIVGSWKDRKMTLTAVQEGESVAAVLSTPLNPKRQLRVEVGPREQIEKASGMVVPDRVAFNDPEFEARFLVRATPPELGEAAFDHSMRRKLLGLPDLWLLAQGKQLEVRVAVPTEASEIREVMDVASSVADAIDGG